MLDIGKKHPRFSSLYPTIPYIHGHNTEVFLYMSRALKTKWKLLVSSLKKKDLL